MGLRHHQRLAGCGSYRVYDADTGHNRLRSEIFAVNCQDIARVQFQDDDQAPGLLPTPASDSQQ